MIKVLPETFRISLSLNPNLSYKAFAFGFSKSTKSESFFKSNSFAFCSAKLNNSFAIPLP